MVFVLLCSLDKGWQVQLHNWIVNLKFRTVNVATWRVNTSVDYGGYLLAASVSIAA